MYYEPGGFGGVVPEGVVVLPGDNGTPLFGDVGEVGGVTVEPLPFVLLFGYVEVLPFGGIAVEGAAVEPVDVPADGLDGLEGVDVPGDVVELGVFTVPSDAMQGVELPGAVVPGRVLGGLLGVPGAL